MKAYPPILLFAILLSSGCSDDGATQISQPKPLDEHPGDAQDSNPYAGPSNSFVSSDRSIEKIMGDFAGPIDTYPVIDQDETVVRQNGRTYRRGLEDEPFNGTVVETFPDGSLSLSTTFYQGKPHGFQKGTSQTEIWPWRFFFRQGNSFRNQDQKMEERSNPGGGVLERGQVQGPQALGCRRKVDEGRNGCGALSSLSVFDFLDPVEVIAQVSDPQD